MERKSDGAKSDGAKERRSEERRSDGVTERQIDRAAGRRATEK